MYIFGVQVGGPYIKTMGHIPQRLRTGTLSRWRILSALGGGVNRSMVRLGSSSTASVSGIIDEL